MPKRSQPAPRQPAVLGGTPRFAAPLYVTRPRLPRRTPVAPLLDSVLESRWLTNDGAMVRRFEGLLRLRLGVGFCASFCNGTIGLLAALRALDLEGEVITTPFTFPASVHAIAWSGLTPVFCDVDAATFNLDPARAEDLVSARTSALLPVHVFGNPCDVQTIDALARRRGLRVVYDAAHAFGVVSHGVPIGCWGDLSMFSFHATKLFHTAEGGAVTAAADGLAGRIRSLRNFAIVDEETVDGIGINGKLSELHAALGVAMLDEVDDEIRARAALAARYRERLGGIAGLSFQRQAPETASNHAYFVALVDADGFGLSRDQLHAALKAENVVCRKYFFPLCSDNPAYRHLPSAAPERLPNAHRLAAGVLCFPLHGDLSADDVDAIADAVLAARDAAPAVRRRLADRG